jgi:hypothetical protein
LSPFAVEVVIILDWVIEDVFSGAEEPGLELGAAVGDEEVLFSLVELVVDDEVISVRSFDTLAYVECDADVLPPLFGLEPDWDANRFSRR